MTKTICNNKWHSPNNMVHVAFQKRIHENYATLKTVSAVSAAGVSCVAIPPCMTPPPKYMFSAYLDDMIILRRSDSIRS